MTAFSEGQRPCKCPLTGTHGHLMEDLSHGSATQHGHCPNTLSGLLKYQFCTWLHTAACGPAQAYYLILLSLRNPISDSTAMGGGKGGHRLIDLEPSANCGSSALSEMERDEDSDGTVAAGGRAGPGQRVGAATFLLAWAACLSKPQRRETASRWAPHSRPAPSVSTARSQPLRATQGHRRAPVTLPALAGLPPRHSATPSPDLKHLPSFPVQDALGAMDDFGKFQPLSSSRRRSVDKFSISQAPL